MKYEIRESWPQTFIAGQFHCSLHLRRVGDEHVITQSGGVGSSCEIARAIAYCELAKLILLLVP